MSRAPRSLQSRRRRRTAAAQRGDAELVCERGLVATMPRDAVTGGARREAVVSLHAPFYGTAELPRIEKGAALTDSPPLATVGKMSLTVLPPAAPAVPTSRSCVPPSRRTLRDAEPVPTLRAARRGRREAPSPSRKRRGCRQPLARRAEPADGTVEEPSTAGPGRLEAAPLAPRRRPTRQASRAADGRAGVAGRTARGTDAAAEATGAPPKPPPALPAARDAPNAPGRATRAELALRMRLTTAIAWIVACIGTRGRPSSRPVEHDPELRRALTEPSPRACGPCFRHASMSFVPRGIVMPLPW